MADYGLLALQEQGQMDRDRAGAKRKSEKKKRKKRSKWISGLGTVGGIAGGLAMNALIPGSGLGLMMASMATGAAAGAGTALGQGIGRGVSKHKGWGADRNLGQGRSVFGGSISAQSDVADAFYGDQDAYNQMEKAGYQSDIINNMMTGAFMQYKGGEQGLKAGNTWANQLKGVGGKLKAKAGGLADMLPQRPMSEWEKASALNESMRGGVGSGSGTAYGAPGSPLRITNPATGTSNRLGHQDFWRGKTLGGENIIDPSNTMAQTIGASSQANPAQYMSLYDKGSNLYNLSLDDEKKTYLKTVGYNIGGFESPIQQWLNQNKSFNRSKWWGGQ
jgi:hypothetical protein